MLSLTGKHHEVWMNIAREEHFQWHDRTAPRAVTYLGYPLYTGSHQLQHCLEELQGKITRHIAILRSRNLSVLGRALTANIFIYDPITKRLRLKVEHEYDHLKKLHRRLYKDILERHTVRLAPHIWPYILKETSIDAAANMEEFFLSQITSATQWRKYCSKTYRLSSYTSRPYLAPSRLTIFWRSPMLLQARSMWYKAMIKKLPTRLLIHQMGVTESPMCLLCLSNIEGLDHLLVTCSVRWSIWIQALAIYYPDLTFDHPTILATIQLSIPPASILDHKRFYTILSTIQWSIWKAYWNFVFDHQPVCLPAILKMIITHVSVLLSSAETNTG